MTKLGNDLFASYRKFKAKMVDSPNYEPLGQSIMIEDSLEERRRKRNEYMRDYREKNRERLRKYQRDYWKKTHVTEGKREGLFGIQKKVYEYLVDYYRRGKDAPRGTQIAKDLRIKDTSVYTAIFQLMKKGYVGKWSMGRYYLTKVPEEPEVQESKDTGKIFMTTEEDYNDLVKMNDKLKKENKELQGKVDELRGSNTALIQERESKISSLNLEIRDLTNELNKRSRDFDELKDAVKVLLKYFQ